MPMATAIAADTRSPICIPSTNDERATPSNGPSPGVSGAALANSDRALTPSRAIAATSG